MGGHRGLIAGFVGLVVVAAGVVSGCSSGAQGVSGPDVGVRVSSSSPAVGVSGSSAPSATASLDGFARERIPRAARAHTAQGAEAFARFYLEQVNKAWMAPDPEQIRPYALASCKTCANYVGTVEWLVAGSLHYDGPPMQLGASVVAPESRHDHAFIELGCNQSQRTILRPDGAIEKSVKHRYGGAQVELLWVDDAWLVREVRVRL
jgi:hypothetical protein